MKTIMAILALGTLATPVTSQPVDECLEVALSMKAIYEVREMGVPKDSLEAIIGGTSPMFDAVYKMPKTERDPELFGAQLYLQTLEHCMEASE